MSVWPALGAAAAATWLLRVLTVTIVPASRLPSRVRHVLPHVAPAVLAALVTAALLSAPDGRLPLFVVAAALAAGVVWRGGSTLAAVLVGLAAVGLLDRLGL